ncbi:MAG: DUF11 domain-containing protein [Chloroflexales bacterium]|nr:DUF11 domain-containing protein [Chloroflexales bacterium]
MISKHPDRSHLPRGFRPLSVVLTLALVLQQLLLPIFGTSLAMAAGGSYSLNFTAADPKINNAPYVPTYAKVPPSQKACLTPSGSAGRAASPLADAVFGSPRDSVESLAPSDMALGQIVPFEVKVSVSGSTAPENGTIQFSPYWLAKTTSGANFGYEPSYGVYCAFVDSADAASVDPAANAKVDSFGYSIAETGTNDEQIQGTIQVSGLDSGDTVIVEIWVVLKNSIPVGSTGNVQSGLLSAGTVVNGAISSTINTGNQTVPLLRVQEFFSSKADLSVTKGDGQSDPATPGGTIQYQITVVNRSTTTYANGIVVTDQLDPNTSYLSASGASCLPSGSVITCTVGSLAPGATQTILLTVNVASNAPTGSTVQDAVSCTVGAAGVDLCNRVSLSAITTDDNSANNSDSEPTNVQVVNHPPVASNDSATTPEDTAVTIPVLSNDTDVDGKRQRHGDRHHHREQRPADDHGD